MEKHNNSLKSYLSFKLGKEYFASNVSTIKNIIEMPTITQIPNAPEYILGVMNQNGEIIPVIDTNIMLGKSTKTTSASNNNSVIVMEIRIKEESILTGMVVDKVEAVIEINEHEILPAPKIGLSKSTRYIQGMVQENDSFVILLNMHKVFTNKEIVELEICSNKVI